MGNYYSDILTAENLSRCYAIAPERIKQYLATEINHATEYIFHGATVLELGCGYGRVLSQIVARCSRIVGIDTSVASLRAARLSLSEYSSVELSLMDAAHLGYSDNSFDVVLCIQNGISAFKRDPRRLISEAYRVAKRGGNCMFSSYSHRFWGPRLQWFKLQSDEGLIGEIDWDLTKDGVIVCKDGFVAKTYSQDDFIALLEDLGLQATYIEVDESSLFCHIDMQDKQ